MVVTQWLELSRTALRQNVQKAKELESEMLCWPCVKANAYGHGLREVVSSIDDLVDGYCVVSTSEALELRNLTDRFIFVLNIVDPDDLTECLDKNIVLPLASSQQAELYKKTNRTVRVHLEVDTGMARTGFKWSDPDQMMSFVEGLPANIKIEGLWSHYAATGENLSYSRGQYDRFHRFVERYRHEVSTDIVIHLDKSGSVFLDDYRWSDDWRGAYRLGIATYGFDPARPGDGKLLPVLSWKTKVISVRPLDPGEPVGYGLTFVPEERTNIATIPVGYADGYDRSLSNVGAVLIGGRRCPVRGRICMNLTMIEVPASVKEGDEVVIIGKQGEEKITAVEVAGWIHTTHYEIITRIHPTIKRLLID